MKKEDKNKNEIATWAITLGIIGLAMIVLPILMVLFKIHVVLGIIVLGVLLLSLAFGLVEIMEG
ncbi:MAG: hypothetical protein IJX99_01095 [Clostridia bacterium]|nr:hypothetical protein [Clostridia bacterium]MBQ8298467.1 hypothetical protein [Clostridia bacterium]